MASALRLRAARTAFASSPSMSAAIASGAIVSSLAARG